MGSRVCHSMQVCNGCLSCRMTKLLTLHNMQYLHAGVARALTEHMKQLEALPAARLAFKAARSY